MANNDVNSNAGHHGNHLLLDTSPGITLDEPNLEQMRQDRQDRTRATMQAVDPLLTAHVLPKVDNIGPQDRAATRIQAQYRGHLGRKKYLEKLYEQFEREEVMRLEKARQQCEQGELLVEKGGAPGGCGGSQGDGSGGAGSGASDSGARRRRVRWADHDTLMHHDPPTATTHSHRLQVQLDDNNTTRRNRSRQYNTHVITIQRAWRSYRRNRPRDPGTPNNNMSPQLSEGEEVSDTESANGAQAMSVSTPDDTSSDKNLNPEDDIQSDPDSTGPNVEDDLTDTQHDGTRTGSAPTQPPGGQWIEPDPNSVVSDYSEMADPLKEHLANVQIIQKEDLEAGNTMCQNHFSVGQKIVRSPDETEEEFSKRLRKINYLSLAQEFAALKKIDADALPFDLLKGGQHDFSPLSETSSETDLTDGSNATTPMEAPAFSATMGIPPSLVNSGHVTARKQKQVEVVNKLTDRFERAINPPVSTTKDAWVAPASNDNNKKAGSMPQPDIINDIDDNLGDDLDGPDVESVTLVPARPDDRKSGSGGNGTEKLGDFDVYNIESTLPQLDWSMLEQQLHRAAEEERQKQQSRRNDREEIRRKLAMGVEEEYYGGERMYKKPNLQTRLQSGMNLQICFMNEATCDADSVNGDDSTAASCKTLPPQDDNATLPTPKTTQGEVIPTKPTQGPTDEKTSVDQRPVVVVDPVTGEVRPIGPRGKEEDEDFFAKQAKLQDEARMALAQVRPMAHMQLEVEKQMRKKSPIAEMVGIPALGAKKKFGRHLLSDMNVAQLQVVVNDLHSQIETLNEELVMMLVGRDDLHMEQDSMLVDIEDHHRRALEVAARVNKPKRTNKKK